MLAGCQTTTSVQSVSTSDDTIVNKPLVSKEAVDIVVPDVVAKTPEQVDNLWRRIQMQFSLPRTINSQVKSQLQWYKKHPKYIDRMSKRAAPYLYLIVEEIEKREMPLEIALLPIVESAFDPFAYSHGAASGMWQIIGDTGKRFGLEQNWWYDGRRDVIASTGAALDYLQFLHKHFKGDWLHALAAYNSGEGRVGRAIRKNKKAGKSIDFWSLKLPAETRDYVPKLLALSVLLNDPELYKIHWPVLANVKRVEQVNVKSQIDLALAAKLAGISVKELYLLNPGFNRWATAPKGDHTLLLPHERVKSFIDALDKTPIEKRLNWTRYKIKSGDTLGQIAQSHQTSTAIIRDVNKIQGNNIRIGKFLLIPIASNKMTDYQLSSDARLAITQGRKRGKVKTIHKVKPGDNLWNIAKKYKVNHRSIAKWNAMAPTDRLRLGRSLVIWLDTKQSPTDSGNQIVRAITYRVRSGDSIAKIAQKFNVKMKDVIRWNALNIKSYLQPGQRIKLHVDVTQITS